MVAAFLTIWQSAYALCHDFMQYYQPRSSMSRVGLTSKF